MINTVVVSALPPDDFQRASEGLGITAQLLPPPAPEDARNILSNFKRMALATPAPQQP